MSFAINKTTQSHFIPPTPPPAVQQKPETSYKASEVKMPSRTGSSGTVINTHA